MAPEEASANEEQSSMITKKQAKSASMGLATGIFGMITGSSFLVMSAMGGPASMVEQVVIGGLFIVFGLGGCLLVGWAINRLVNYLKQ